MFGHSRALWRSVTSITSVFCLLLIALASCGGSPAAGISGPITIGVSLSLSGDFSSDGKAFEQGYQLWADSVNAHGGLLGRHVQIVILPDDSSEAQVTANYEKLITQDHVDLLFGPYSTLLTKPASVVANQYGYALVEGAGGGPSIFNRGLYNIFDVSLPVANNLESFATWILSLPASQRPKSVVYATEDDPFTQPQVDLADQLLTKGGITAAIPEIVYSAATTNYAPIAQKVIAAKADVVILGTMLPDAVAFVQAFKQAQYSPKVLIDTAGPDQGAQFLQAIGGSVSAEGMMVPDSWFAEENTPGNAALIQAYIAVHGGTPDAISADVAEAYSVGQVMQQAVTKIDGFDQTKLVEELHSDTFTTVQGPVRFDSTGQNTIILSYLFQWQKGSLVPIFPADVTGAKPPEYPKSQWP